MSVYCKFAFIGLGSSHRGTGLCGPGRKHKDQHPKGFWNSDIRSQAKKSMTDNIPIPVCQNCYYREKAGAVSWRHEYNSFYKNTPIKKNPVSLDLDWSNFCNLKCIMCNSNRSSTWANETGDFKSSNGVQTISPQVLKDICEMSTDVEHINLQGGEPSLIPEYDEYIDFLVDKELAKNINIGVVSNLTNINNRFYNNLKKFKLVTINASVDGYGKSNDFIRYPSNFKQVTKNIKALADTKFELSIHVALQTLSIFGFEQFMNWIIEMQNLYAKKNKMLRVNLQRVYGPIQLDILSAPTYMKNKFLTQLEKYLKSSTRIKSATKFDLELINLKKTLFNSNNIDRTKPLYEYINQLCTIRKLKIEDYIPDFYG
tara:strand:- start:5129 stop:6241 length:1113 start_codon:yes stop_codon:yes gene_type:complete